MFGRKKDDGTTTPPKPEAAPETPATPAAPAAPAAADSKADALPPLKPFTRKGSHSPTKTPSTPAAFRNDLPPRRVLDIPGAAPRSMANNRRNDDPAHKLVVGKEISLKGEITSCQVLSVEGRVDATINDAEILEINDSGVYTGVAHVEEADISGSFDGDLVAFKVLTIRAGGRVKGNVRYGKIVIEEGGEISGEMSTLTEAEMEEIRSAAAP